MYFEYQVYGDEGCLKIISNHYKIQETTIR